MMNVTVAICTWNRAELLDKTLEQMCLLEIPKGFSWELLVVNNNCTDNTDEVIQKYHARLPIRKLFEPIPGQGRARNCAIDSAQGELLIWTDDDVLVSKGWLASYESAAAEFPDFAVFGGRVDPLWETQPPNWILRHLQRLSSTFALRQLGEGVRAFGEHAIPIGANMAMRRSIYSTHRFDPRLGNAGNNNLRGEDAEFLRRLESEGTRFLWVSPASVQHFVPAKRLTARYVWQWYRGGACSNLIRQGTDPEGKVPRWLYRQYLECWALALVTWMGKGDRWFKAFRRAAMTRGMMDFHSRRHL